MDYRKWLLILVFSFMGGALLLKFLTVHPLTMNLYLFLTCLSFFVLTLALGKFFNQRQLLSAILFSLVLLLVGYSLATWQFLARQDPRPVPEITRSKEDPGKGHSAVIYFTHGEPETYDPIGWINQFREFDEQGIPFVPFLVRPIFAYQLRQHYLEVGQSNHRQMHVRMLSELEQAYRREGDEKTRFYISFLDDNPRPDAAVIEALNDGASHIVVSEVFLTISNHTAEGKELIEALNIEEYGVPLNFSGPLWDSDTLRSMFLNRANQHLGGTEKPKVGVLLVGHGQPDEWDQEWPTETEQELEFREDVLKLFLQDGYRRGNMGLAWMAFKEPKPSELVEKFWANGVEKVLFFSAAISADSIHSQYDIPKLVQEANVPDELQLINLGAWNDDPLVIAAIKEKIDPFLKSGTVVDLGN